MYIKNLNEEIEEINKKLKSRKTWCARKEVNWEKDAKCLEFHSKMMELKRRKKTMELAVIKKNEERMKQLNNNGRKQYDKGYNYI